MLKQALYASFSRSGLATAAWNARPHRFRILSYHGVCDDSYAAQDWVPPYFVTASLFESHLRYLKQNASILTLACALQRLKEGTLPARTVVITFDDGYANNLHLAVPLLKRYSLQATIFVSTGLVQSQDFFVFHKLMYLERRGFRPPKPYKTNPLADVESSITQAWSETKSSIPVEQCEMLRAMTVDELRQIPSELVELGSHTHRHVILRNENRQTRNSEILTSIARIREWTGIPVQTFSYPNGLSGDFDDSDKEVLRSAGVQGAVSAIAGSNTSHTDAFELHRYPVTMNHDLDTFIAELTGFRAFVKRISN